MTPERYEQVCELYHAALEQPTDERASFLNQKCSNDEALRGEVESMLRAHEGAGNFFATPAMEVAVGLLANQHRSSLLGQHLNQYQVLSLIGAGGMGEVYLAEDSRLGRKVALKLLPVEFTRDADRVRRFELEARAASALNHPNIITIHEIGQVDSAHYIVTEFVEGETLRQQMGKGKLEIGAALEISGQVASALAVAHAAGIVHRDIKPENIMVRPDGLVKILDFGLAKLTEQNQAKIGTNMPTVAQNFTEPGQVMGTPSYMSPEQARGVGVDARSDIFSLGVVLYEMIAGRKPFNGATATDVVISIVQQEPESLARCMPETSPELECIVGKSLSKGREARYQTAAELLADLKRLQQQLASESLSGYVRETSPGSRTKERQIWPWALAAGIAILLAVGGWWSGWQRSGTPVATERPVIVVLPFKNLSNEKDSEYFADGLTDELIRNLSIIEGLEVRSRTSSFAFKDKQTNIREVGEKLKANWVLDGSVLRAEGKLRINAQFVRVDADKPEWTGRFDREPKDIFQIQDEISLGIVNQLRLNLGRGRRRYETSVEAYDLYLLAGSKANLPDRPVLRFAKQIRLYEEVLAKDLSFAPAYAKLALLHAEQSVQFPLGDPGDAVTKLRIAAEKAIQLDPLLEEAHVALGRMHSREGHWEQAENSFREAIRLNPNRSDTYIQYADWLLEPVGRVSDAIKQFQYAEKVDPLSIGVKSNLATVLITLGRYDEAEAYIRQLRGVTDTVHYSIPERTNVSIQLARLRLSQERVAEAIQILENRPERPNNPLLRGWLGNAYARSGRREEAEQIAAVSQFANERALIFAGLSDKDRTLEALEGMGSRGPQRVGRFLSYPEFGFLRDDPRLAILRKKVGLPQ